MEFRQDLYVPDEPGHLEAISLAVCTVLASSACSREVWRIDEMMDVIPWSISSMKVDPDVSDERAVSLASFMTRPTLMQMSSEVADDLEHLLDDLVTALLKLRDLQAHS